MVELPTVVPERKRIVGIDLLRGLAIVFVLLNHIHMRLLGSSILYTKGWPTQLELSLVWNGQFAVQMFFVLSGFLITSTTLKRWHSFSEVRVLAFYKLRFARIAPLLALVLSLLSLLHGMHLHGFTVSEKVGGLPAALFAALTFHVNWLEASKGYLPGAWDILWSLSVEEMFYLFFPIACVLLRRRRYLMSVWGIFILLGPFARSHAFNHNPVWREYSYLGGMDAIAMGCMMGVILDGRKLRRRASQISLMIGASLLVFSLFCSQLAYRWGLGKNGLNMSLLAIGTSFLIAYFVSIEWHPSKIFSPLLLAGASSYEVYLTHEFVVLALWTLFMSFGGPIYGVVPLFVLTLAISVIIGTLVARFYSEPANKTLRRYFFKGLKEPSTVVSK